MRDELKYFLKEVPKNIVVVIDGAYSEFVTDNLIQMGLI